MGGTEKYILILDFDVAKEYKFQYNKPMTKERALEVQELVFKETGHKPPILDFTTLRKEGRNER